jgi:hypothetical protein
MLSVANKQHGEKLKRYLQTGNMDDLGEFKIDSIFNLKQTIEILQKLTGQDRVIRTETTNKGEVLHRHEGTVTTPVLSVSKGPTAQEAADVLKNLKALLPVKSN